MIFETTAYQYATLPQEHQIQLKEICLSRTNKFVRSEAIRDYCNQHLFDYVVRGLNPTLLSQYLEHLYL